MNYQNETKEEKKKVSKDNLPKKPRPLPSPDPELSNYLTEDKRAVETVKKKIRI